MALDCLPDDLRNLWQELSVNPHQVSVHELRAEVGLLKKMLSRRLVVCVGAGLTVALSFVAFFFVFSSALERIGSLMTVAGAGYLVGQILLRRSRSRPDMTETDCLRFYREELERQRDFHRGWWLWSRAAAILPGPLVFIVGFSRTHPDVPSFFIWEPFAVIPAVLAFCVVRGLRAARKYQRRIDTLDRSQRSE